jgi:O-antigen ligase
MKNSPLLLRIRLGFNARAVGLERALWVCLVLVAATTIFSIAVTQFLIVVMSVLWLIVLARSKGRNLKRTPLDIPFLAFIAGRAVSVPFSIDPAVSVPGLYKEVFFYIMFFLAVHVLRAGDSERDTVTILWVITAAAVIASLVGIARYVLGFVERAASTTSGYYTLGLFLALVLPLPLLLAGREGVFRSHWVPVAAVVAVCAGIVFTFDRLHWIGMVVAIIIAGLFRNRRMILVFGACAAILAITIPDIRHRLMELVNIGSNLSGRDVLWRGAWMIKGTHPVLGFGLRTFSLIFPIPEQLPNPMIGSWHNDYLQLYFDGGLVALLGFLWFVVSLYRCSWKAYRLGRMSATERYLLSTLLLSVTLLFVMGGMLDLIVGVTARIFFAMIAVIVAGVWWKDGVRIVPGSPREEGS